MKPVSSFPLIYNDRIYYLNDEEERERVMKNPHILASPANIVAPSDVAIVPSVAVIGLPKTGKTTLAENLSKKLGLVRLDIQEIVEGFFTQDHLDIGTAKILESLRKGNTLTDAMLLDLLQKRVSMSDCQTTGYVFDGFPYNRDQCYSLNKRGLLPFNVFTIKLTEQEIKTRVISLTAKDRKLSSEYDYDLEVLHTRLI